MKNSTRGIIISLSTILCLSMTSITNAQTPPRSIRDSEILPYLLDHPQNNSSVRVRCVSHQTQETNRKRRIIRDSLLQDNTNTVTIEIEGNCRGVRIISPETPEFFHPSDFNDQWLIREGSGWNWLLNR